MRVILSPAKTMKLPKADCALTSPLFLSEAKSIINQLQQLSVSELEKLMKMNQHLAELNHQRYQEMQFDLGGTPALLTYDGMQYGSIGTDDFSSAEQEHLQQTLAILSGLYGVLRPYDSIYPYRLEMQTKLPVEAKKNLYLFWGSKLYDELVKGNDTIINLASKEYSKAIEPFLTEDINYITCTFQVEKKGVRKVESTQAKKARGLMVRYIAKNQIAHPEHLKNFSENGYKYDEINSSESEFIFIKVVENT